MKNSSTYMISLKYFKNICLKPLNTKIVRALSETINYFREGNPIDEKLVMEAIDIYKIAGIQNNCQLEIFKNHQTNWTGEHSLSVYFQLFERKFNRYSIDEFYNQKLTKLLKEESFPDFLKAGLGIIERERIIRTKFLDPSTNSKAYEDLIYSIQGNKAIVDAIEAEAKNLKPKFYENKYEEIVNLQSFCAQTSLSVTTLEKRFFLIVTEILDSLFADKCEKNRMELTKSLLEYNVNLSKLIKGKLANSITFHKGKFQAFMAKIKNSYETPWLAEY